MEKKKTSAGTWIVFIIVMFLIPVAFAYGFFAEEPLNLFEGKSERCKKEAQERAVSLRDANLRKLKLKENPTPQDLEEIEELEIKQEAGLVNRNDYEYFYKDCMR